MPADLQPQPEVALGGALAHAHSPVNSGAALLAERLDALAEVVRLPQQAVGEPLELEPEVERAVVGGVEDALRHRERERRVPGQLLDEAPDGSVELVGGHDRADEPERERLLGEHPPAAHDDVLRPAEADQAREPLRPARARDHPDRHLGEAELDVVGGEPEVAGERELEPDAEDVPLEPRDHRLRAALGRGDVPRELRDLPRRRVRGSPRCRRRP